MSQQNKATIRRFLEEVVSRGNMLAADELLSPDLAFYPPGRSEPLNRDGFKEFVKMFRSAFPDMRDVIEELIAEGDKVAVRVTIKGTHLGEFQGIAASGRAVSFSGFGIYRLVNGRIAEFSALNDRLALLEQIGE